MKRKRSRDACRSESFTPSIEEILRRYAPLNDSNREFEESNDFCRVVRGVHLLLVEDGTILLVKHTYRAGRFLPGGRPDRGESLAQTAQRG